MHLTITLLILERPRHKIFRENRMIAIIMSVYKNDIFEYVKEAIESIVNQDDIEPRIYVYIDGFVPDNISNYLNALFVDGVINLIHSDENKGLPFALNFLIELALLEPNIKYIARMDSDDISLPMRLIRQVEFMDSNPNVDVLGTGCEEFGSSFSLNKKILPINHCELEDFSIVRCPFIHPTVMFRRRVFEEGNRYPTHTSFTEDMAFWLELLYKKYTFHNLPDILLRYRVAENTITRRAGLSKAKSEVSLRLGYMFLLDKFNFKNMALIYSRYFFHLLPPSLMKLVYKYLRG